MAEKTEETKDDAATLDKIADAIGGLCKRMDAMEGAEKAKSDAAKRDSEETEAKAKADAEEAEKKEREDKARKDAEGEEGSPERVAADKKRKDAEDEAEKAKADAAAKADADAALKARLDSIEKLMPKQRSDADYAAMADAQARADAVFQAFGDSAPRPLDGEDLTAYRVRLASKLQGHAPRYKDVNLGVVAADSAAFGIMEEHVYADAMSAAMRPADLPQGELREIKSRDTTGRQISTFAGEPSAWLDQFSGSRARLTGISRAGIA